MKKRTRILNVLVVVVIVLQPVLCFGGPINMEELEFRDGVYYYKNKPYTGEFRYDQDGPGCDYDCDFDILYSIGNIKNGKINGEVKSYRNKKLDGVQNYKDGGKHGEWKEFDENGNLSSVKNYKDNKRHGEWKEFHKNGKLKFEENYKDDKPYGEWKEFDENGKLIKAEIVGDGTKETFTDRRDGKKYKIVKIGIRTWMAENLNYKQSESVCYNNEQKNCDEYGRLYDWNTAKKACPSGWHLPNDEEWEKLQSIAGDYYTAEYDYYSISGKKLKSKSGWNGGGNGTDDYGFSALPGGVSNSGSFSSVGDWGSWWSASEYGSDAAGGLSIDYRGVGTSTRYMNNKNSLFSVRCIQNLESDNSTADMATINGERKYFHENGNLSSAGNYKDGKQQGEWKYFHENGNLSSVGNYKDGKQQGKWKFFYENGDFKLVRNYKDGKLLEGDSYAEKGYFIDFRNERDEKKYKIVKISEQTWMAENLNYETEGSKCYDSKPENCTKYGRLYDWTTAMTVCPSGWHLPSDDEWKVLENVAGKNVAGNKLKAKSGWGNKNLKDDINGTDEYGFSALPGGSGTSGAGFNFVGIGYVGNWWSATLPYYRQINKHSNVFRYNSNKFNLYSVRCLQDGSATKVYNKCNNQLYNPETQACHTDNKIYDKCDKSYNSKTHFCNYADKKIYAKCGDKAYDPETQFCHTDKKIYAKCSDKAYKPETQFCHTDNKIYAKCDKPYNPKTHFCNNADKKIYAKCDDKTYSPEIQFCHTDKKVYFKCDKPYNPKTHFCRYFYDKKVYAKCGDLQYDPGMQFCHTDNKIYSKCDQAYNLETQFCYLNKIYDKCGNLQYNPEIQFCHIDNKVHNKVESDVKPECDKTYDPKTQFCHTDNKIYIKCDLPYNPETQFCYLNMIYNYCGGKTWYNPEAQFCHTDNKVYFKCDSLYNPETHFCNFYDKKVYAKCGDLQYNPEMQVCHTDNKVYLKCGNQIYNPATHYCRTTDGTTHTCGNKPYNPEMQFCHTDNLPYNKCGDKPYSPETQFCNYADKKIYDKCGNQIYNPATQFCHTDKKAYNKCGDKPYSPETQFCNYTDKKIYNKCGDKTYKPETQFCHTDNTVKTYDVKKGR